MVSSETRLLLSAVIWGLLCVIASFYVLFISNNGLKVALANEPSLDSLEIWRPLLSADVMKTMNLKLFNAETTFFYEVDNQAILTVGHVQSATTSTLKLPLLFYEGYIFGITFSNSHGLEYSSSELTFTDLIKDLKSATPSPSEILHGVSHNKAYNWMDEYYCAYYNSSMIDFSNITVYQSIENTIINIARKHKQVYVVTWRPYTYGDVSDADPTHQYTILLHDIIPTRTGLHDLRSTVTVWPSV